MNSAGACRDVGFPGGNVCGNLPAHCCCWSSIDRSRCTRSIGGRCIFRIVCFRLQPPAGLTNVPAFGRTVPSFPAQIGGNTDDVSMTSSVVVETMTSSADGERRVTEARWMGMESSDRMYRRSRCCDRDAPVVVSSSSAIVL